jgi:hypothetical protein
MKGLNKLVLASAIAAISAGANAELKALDDSAMGELTGQAGLTIDIETEYTIGEFAYEDAGFVLLQNISMGGSDLYGGGMLDNIRLNIDVAGSGAANASGHGVDNVLDYGFSELQDLAQILVTDYSNGDENIGRIANGGTLAEGGLNLNGKKTFGDGDLVIHVDATDHLEKMGGFAVAEAALGGVTFAQLVPAVHAAVDFKFSIDAIGIAASTYVVGSSGLDTDGNHTTGTHEGAADTTTLISGLSIQGYLGPCDLHIENNGNGFDGTGQGGVAGTGNADSKIFWDSYVDVTDLDVYIDIAGVQISDMTINNTRGDTTNIDGFESFGFAHTKKTIYAVKDAVLNMHAEAGINGSANAARWVDGIALNTQFKGDMKIGALSFGDTGTSIGSIYLTDITSNTNWTISAH